MLFSTGSYVTVLRWAICLTQKKIIQCPLEHLMYICFNNITIKELYSDFWGLPGYNITYYITRRHSYKLLDIARKGKIVFIVLYIFFTFIFIAYLFYRTKKYFFTIFGYCLKTFHNLCRKKDFIPCIIFSLFKKENQYFNQNIIIHKSKI